MAATLLFSRWYSLAAMRSRLMSEMLPNVLTTYLGRDLTGCAIENIDLQSDTFGVVLISSVEIIYEELAIFASFATPEFKKDFSGVGKTAKDSQSTGLMCWCFAHG